MADTLFKKGIDAKATADELVVPLLPEEEIDRFYRVLTDWNGREADVIQVMQYAAQQEKAPEYLGRLEETLKEHLSRVPIADRRNFAHPLVCRTERAVTKMYQDLGIEPVEEPNDK